MTRQRLKYWIPKGTKVEVQDTTSARPRGKSAFVEHVTRKDLYFDELTNVGWGFAIWYFTYDKWLISVNSKMVHRANEESIMTDYCYDWKQEQDDESIFYSGCCAIVGTATGPMAIAAQTVDDLKILWHRLTGLELDESEVQAVKIRPAKKENNSRVPRVD